ncbi:MAG: tetratricopeptide repeat protein [Candidatus Eremiobacterota bacterium]
MATASELYEEGLEAVQSGDLERAMNCFHWAVQQEDGRAEYHAALGNLYLLNGDAEAALIHLKQACELDTSSSEHRSDLAGVLFQKGMFRDAIHFYQEAVEGDPTNAEHFYRLGCAFFYQAEPNYERARAALRQAAALYPTNDGYQRMLGLACYHMGQYAEAADALRAASRLGNSPAVNYNLACSLLAQGEFAEAAEAAERALDENEEEWDPRVVRVWARALHRSEQWEKALEAFSLAVQLEPDDPRLFELQADVLMHLEQFEKAAMAFKKAALLAPDRADLHYGQGTALMRAGQPERALGALKAALERRPEYADALNNLALCHHLAGQGEPARVCIARALALDPDKPEYKATRARLESAGGTDETRT